MAEYKNYKKTKMANTYTQLYFHIVFAVQGRSNQVDKEWKDELYKYITGILKNKKQKLMIINGMPDHIHILISTKPDFNLCNLIRDVKSSSTNWINAKKFVKSKFAWQEGFGTLTVSQSGVDKMVSYIKNQEKHHEKKTFLQEYKESLDAYQVEYKPEYLFKEV